MSETQTTSIEIPAGFVMDRNGSLIPKDKVKPIDKDRDRLVKRIAKEAQKLSGTIADFRDQAFVDVADFAQRSADKYGAKLGGNKGNMTLHSYDGALKVVIANSEHKAFDERLQAAKALIDECIHDWMKGSNKNIQVLVNDAFQVDREGLVSVSRILGLRRIEIDDERWHNAMNAIADAIQITGSKRYFRVYERIGESDKYRPISLDAANA